MGLLQRLGGHNSRALIDTCHVPDADEGLMEGEGDYPYHAEPGFATTHPPHHPPPRWAPSAAGPSALADGSQHSSALEAFGALPLAQRSAGVPQQPVAAPEPAIPVRTSRASIGAPAAGPAHLRNPAPSLSGAGSRLLHRSSAASVLADEEDLGLDLLDDGLEDEEARPSAAPFSAPPQRTPPQPQIHHHQQLQQQLQPQQQQHHHQRHQQPHHDQHLQQRDLYQQAAYSGRHAAPGPGPGPSRGPHAGPSAVSSGPQGAGRVPAATPSAPSAPVGGPPGTKPGGAWWEDLDDLLGGGRGEGAGAVANGAAGQQAGRPRPGGAAGPRQATLTAGGGVRLPPPPPPGAAWLPQRPSPAATGPAEPPKPPPSAAQALQQRAQRQTLLPFPVVGQQGLDTEGIRAASPAATSSGAAPAPGPGAGATAVGAKKRGRADAAASGSAAGGSDAAGTALQGPARITAAAAVAAAAPTTAAAARKRAAAARAGGDAAVRAQLAAFCEGLDEPGPGAVRVVLEPSAATALKDALSSEGCVRLVGALVAAAEGGAVQFATHVTPLNKPQRDALSKARRLLIKHGLPTVTPVLPPPQGPDGGGGSTGGGGAADLPGGGGVAATEHPERCVAICVMVLSVQQYESYLTSAGVVPGTAPTSAAAIPLPPLWVLPTGPWPPPSALAPAPGPGGPGGAQGGPLPPRVLRALLELILARGPRGGARPGPRQGPVLCCNAKSVMRDALLAGWLPPPPSSLPVLDPLLLGWMAEPQLAQRDEKEIEGYTLEALCGRYEVPSPLWTPPGGAGALRPAAALGPLARVRAGVLAGAVLLEAVRARAQPWLRPQAIHVEMQVSCLLARMEAVGMAVDAAGLAAKGGAVEAAMEAATQQACSLLGGRGLNLGSSAQLAVVLYEELRLPHPGGEAGGTGKDRQGRTRTHATTDEATLKALTRHHPLPGLVLQYRSLQNVLSKWLAPDWLPLLLERSGAEPGPAGPAAGPGAGPAQARLPRLSCCWNQTATATGRLSSSAPNMQASGRGWWSELAVTKYDVTVELPGGGPGGGGAAGGGGGAGGELRIVARSAFTAPPSRLLLSADYSQIELRLLAHLSGDRSLQELLRRGTDPRGAGDAFRHIAAAWLRPGTDPADVSSRDREQAKRIIYGIIYGMTPQGLAQALAEQGVGVDEAAGLRASFLRAFAGVASFCTSALHHARRCCHVTTGLLGRRRPLPGLASADPRARSDAERKVVNSIVQGSAADLMKMAMCVWAAYSHPDTPAELARQQQQQQQQPAGAPGGAVGGAGPGAGQGQGPLTLASAAGPVPLPPAALPPPDPAGGGWSGGAELIAQIHDELLFEVDARPDAVRRLVCAVRAIMCGVVQLDGVPLQIKVAAGRCWGTMQELPSDETSPAFAEALAALGATE
ncbi:hypothetical protein HYH03_011232 [Edaphochlamys debaryana]|uniref:DNA-directed DNA polymerase family A palm domain-containing protein n=1 Tax=Edaphochlamys debaryana TaxID=47281 RepID=A0A835Y0H0_9CHLO|nr:hypothetical protein HYH03_011232 [Edaphochlamys debaryana]|eukprot:KAG2490280.1 hypothetical protein HYH03_011232 [Edaphochlamys debaryana]